ncbi:5358_t:CDS:2, partial [Gigaspora rosea]
TRQQPSAMLDSSEGIGLDLYQNQYSSYYSSESNVLYEDIYSESQYEEYSHGELYETFISSELSDSSSENEPADCNINSHHKYSFYIKVNDPFNSFEEIGKKLDKYAMERGFAVRKGHTCTREDGSVWNATWVCHRSGQWKPKKKIDPDK